MTVLRARATDAQGNPVQGRTAVLEPYTANRYRTGYTGSSTARGLPAMSGTDGWMSWNLPALLRRPGPKGTYWLITGLETQPVVAATQPSDGTVTLDAKRVGTLDARGNLVVPPAVDTASEAAAAAASAQASAAALSAGAPSALDTLAEIAAVLNGRLAGTAIVSVVSAGTDLTVARPAGVGVVYWKFSAGTNVGTAGANVVNRQPGDLIFVAS